jgi:hypothetical protein
MKPFDMLAYLPFIVSIIVCLLAWYLTLVSKDKDIKLQNERKMNRLIFNLLELRLLIQKEAAVDEQINQLLKAYESEVSRYKDKFTKEQFQEARETITVAVKEMVLRQTQLLQIEGSINDILNELAEVDPVFAFELNGRFQITAHIQRLNDMMPRLVPESEGQEMPRLIVDKLLRPKIVQDLLNELNNYLPVIAKKGGKDVYKKYLALNIPQSVEINMQELNQFLSGFVPMLFEFAETIPRKIEV